MPSRDPQTRALIAKIAAHESWARTTNPAARTAAARKAAIDRFERQVDPDGVLPPADRARRAAHARSAHFQRLALKSAVSRRKAAEYAAAAASADAEMAAGGDAA